MEENYIGALQLTSHLCYPDRSFSALVSFAFEDSGLFLKIKCTFKVQKLIITEDIEKILRAITKRECFKKLFKQR